MRRRAFFADILPFLKDARYIRIDNRPLLIIYRPHLFGKERVKTFIRTMRHRAHESGLNGIYFMVALTHNFESTETPSEWGFDAGVEFPPHGFARFPKKQRFEFLDEHFTGTIFDMEEIIGKRLYMRTADFPLFRTVFPSWDNTARKAYSNAAVLQLSPDLYKAWLVDMLKWTQAHHPPQESVLFINAWNEWAEGAHLEPDQRYGYAFLQATRDALEHMSSS